MNNPNPFVPQGSLLEQHKRRSRMKLAVFCAIAVSVAGLSAMLIEGCKREQTENPPELADTNQPTVDTNQPPLEASNPPVVVPPLPTNQPIVTPPVAPIVPTPTETESTYVVVARDTLGKIAKAHGVSLKALEAANPNVQPTKLKVGDKLNIPAGGSSAAATETSNSADMSGGEVYVVKSGDTLTKIAHANGTTVKAIETANNLTTTKIKVGQKLKIPAKAEAAATTVAPAPASAPAPIAPAPAQGNSPTQQQ